MEKVLRMDESIFELATRHPEVVGIMTELGFHDIAKPGMLHTAGRFMTLSKGSKLKKIDPDLVKMTFQRYGFTITE
ncbi:DUF1858 domain-containing protein [Paenibacillus sp. sgz500958]|uniref:DUF1858 domain-containing protein n=1 Tax=Paenibacillus sp. sgz500958 TaxID=3242475 RepID=UPI0036D37AB3